MKSEPCTAGSYDGGRSRMALTTALWYLNVRMWPYSPRSSSVRRMCLSCAVMAAVSVASPAACGSWAGDVVEQIVQRLLHLVVAVVRPVVLDAAAEHLLERREFLTRFGRVEAAAQAAEEVGHSAGPAEG